MLPQRSDNINKKVIMIAKDILNYPNIFILVLRIIWLKEMLIHKMYIKMYNCRKCGRKFKQKSDIDRHMNRKKPCDVIKGDKKNTINVINAINEINPSDKSLNDNSVILKFMAEQKTINEGIKNLLLTKSNNDQVYSISVNDNSAVANNNTMNYEVIQKINPSDKSIDDNDKTLNFMVEQKPINEEFKNLLLTKSNNDPLYTSLVNDNNIVVNNNTTNYEIIKKPKTASDNKMKRQVTVGQDHYVVANQEYKCANKPGANLKGINGYECLLWKYVNGTFDKAGYVIDHIEEFCINGNDDTENLQALCPMCHFVKSNFFTTKHKKNKNNSNSIQDLNSI